MTKINENKKVQNIRPALLELNCFVLEMSLSNPKCSHAY